MSDETVYDNGWFRVERRKGTTMHRVAGAGHGAIAVPYTDGRDGPGMLFGLHRRYALDDKSDWELPRGSAAQDDADGIGTALRELGEETGIDAPRDRATLVLDHLHADTGLVRDDIAVVMVDVTGLRPGRHDDEMHELRWFRPLDEDIPLTDALSIAALHLTLDRLTA